MGGVLSLTKLSRDRSHTERPYWRLVILVRASMTRPPGK